MPDTKAGREQKGRNKRRQLESHLNRRELNAADEPPEPSVNEVDSEYLTDTGPEYRLDIDEFDR